MIYFIQAGKNGPIKIGQSDNPKERLNQLQTANPYELKLLWIFNNDNSGYDEANIQALFSQELIRGEWFRPSRKIFDFITTELKNFYRIPLLNSDHNITICEEYPIDLCVDGDGFFLTKIDNTVITQTEKPYMRKSRLKNEMV